MFLAAVGEQILTYRETAGLGQADLAERIGLSVDLLDEIEHGWLDPTLTVMQALADALDATLAELLDVDGSELGVAATVASNGD
jgi:ribosome-binding protein aMBF1 (putative translation factor)